MTEFEKFAADEFAPLRSDWSLAEVEDLFALPFPVLIYRAQRVHRQRFDPAEIQISTLMSIKTGGCPEDCAYCPQSAHFDTGVEREKLSEVEEVLAEARAARDSGATRFCMGAAWKFPNRRDFPLVLEMVREVKSLGLETCVTLGSLEPPQAEALRESHAAQDAARVIHEAPCVQDPQQAPL